MVYAVTSPLEYGPFFLRGDFVGWNELIDRLSRESLQPKEIAYVEAENKGRPVNWGAVTKLGSRTTSKFKRDLGPIEEKLQPFLYQIERGGKTLGSWIDIGLVMVDADLKVIIEEFEPDVHQFWPIEIRRPNGERTKRDFYALIIRRFHNSMIAEESELSGRGNENVRFAYDDTLAGLKKLTLSANRVGGTHLWRERVLLQPNIFMSDELNAAIKAKGLRLPRRGKVRVT